MNKNIQREDDNAAESRLAAAEGGMGYGEQAPWVPVTPADFAMLEACRAQLAAYRARHGGKK